MALPVEALINDDRFSGGNVLHFLVYLPFGLVIMVLRVILTLILWGASIVLPDKSSTRQLLSTIACCAFGIYVKVKGKRDPRCGVLVANSVSALDSLAASHVLGTITLRKWRIPPFFASSLGIRSTVDFDEKEYESGAGAARPLLLQPEPAAASGRALLAFTSLPVALPTRVQPLAVSAWRLFTRITVQERHAAARFPWQDALWFLWSPVTVFTLTLLPPAERRIGAERSEPERSGAERSATEDDAEFAERVRRSIADALKIEASPHTWADVARRMDPPGAPPAPALARLVRRVKEVLPHVPLADIQRDLARTRNVDVTITNFLEGFVAYAPEPAPSAPPAPATPAAAPKYHTPAPKADFPKSAKDRQLSFQERKAEMIAAARQRYIEKHGLKLPPTNYKA